MTRVLTHKKKKIKGCCAKINDFKEELKRVCNLLSSEDSLTVEPNQFLLANNSIPNNNSAPSNTEEPREHT